MASAAWKRFEKSEFVQRNKARLRQLIGQELKLKASIQLNTVSDGGWCYEVSELNEDGVVYSLGVGDNIDFDLALISRCGASVHAFDPTPDAVTTLGAESLPPQFHFHSWAAAGEDGVLRLYPRVRANGTLSDTMFTLVPEELSKDKVIEVPAYTIASLMHQLGHDHIDLLKMDIEGAEYDVIDGLLKTSCRPRQILIEFHHRHAGIDKEQTTRAINGLEAAGYKIYFVSDSVREVSFIFEPDGETMAQN